jgi:CBS domain-containing protein
MLVADIMTTAVVTTRPEARAKDVLRELTDRKITALPVLDQDDRLVGIVSEADLLRDSMVRDPRSTLRRDQRGSEGLAEAARTVGDVMTRQVITASPNQDVSGIVSVMLETGIHSVPVVLAHRVVGMLSRSDVVRAMARADARIAADVDALLQEAGLEAWDCVVDQGHVRLRAELLDAAPPADVRLASSLARTIAGVRSVSVELAQWA